jgi:hypothetical protein
MNSMNRLNNARRDAMLNTEIRQLGVLRSRYGEPIDRHFNSKQRRLSTRRKTRQNLLAFAKKAKSVSRRGPKKGSQLFAANLDNPIKQWGRHISGFI